MHIAKQKTRKKTERSKQRTKNKKREKGTGKDAYKKGKCFFFNVKGEVDVKIKNKKLRI